MDDRTGGVRFGGGHLRPLAIGAMLSALLIGPPALGQSSQDSVAETGVDLESVLGLDEELGEGMTIESGVLQMSRLPDESRLLVFEQDVSVQQGQFELFADELKARYPPGATEPDRHEARGRVRVVQPGQRAWCEEADFDRRSEQLICRVSARLERGCDTVWGDEIELDLRAQRARVIGGARVQILGDGARPGCTKAQAALGVDP